MPRLNGGLIYSPCAQVANILTCIFSCLCFVSYHPIERLYADLKIGAFYSVNYQYGILINELGLSIGSGLETLLTDKISFTMSFEYKVPCISIYNNTAKNAFGKDNSFEYGALISYIY